MFCWVLLEAPVVVPCGTICALPLFYHFCLVCWWRGVRSIFVAMYMLFVAAASVRVGGVFVICDPCLWSLP